MAIEFQADADIHPGIVLGFRRRIPGARFDLAQGRIVDGTQDWDVLAMCADQGLVLVSRDQNTMRAEFRAFVQRQDHPGLVIVSQTLGIGRAIEQLETVWELASPRDLKNSILWAGDLAIERFR
ncbi:MAG: hypothetical protein SFV18_14090 [Bryobacteraceae bacterium]|nr:hypothetical protein [Bryobacteraceae bacterium]